MPFKTFAAIAAIAALALTPPVEQASDLPGERQTFGSSAAAVDGDSADMASDSSRTWTTPGASSARYSDLSAPLSLLALIGASGALVAAGKRKREKEKSGLSEVQRRRQSKVEKRWKKEAEKEAERKKLDSHRGMDAKIDRMEAAEMKNQRQYFKFSSKRRREAGDTSNDQFITTPPLTPEQYAAVKNWNTIAQVGVYGFTAGLGVVMGFWVGAIVPGGAVAGAVIGAVAGATWGAYEANCIASVQDEFDKAYASNSGVKITRNGLSYEVYGGGDTYSVANAPLSVAYVAATALILTGQP